MRHSHLLLRTRIIALSLGFTALIALGVIIVSLALTRDRALRTAAQSIEYNLQVAATAIARDVDELDNLLAWSSVDPSLRNYIFHTGGRNALSAAYDTMGNKYSSLHTAMYLQRYIVTNGTDCFLQRGTSTTHSRALNAESIGELPGFADGAEEISWSGVVDDPLILTGPRQIIPVLSSFRNTATGRTGWVYLAVSPALIGDTLRDFVPAEGTELYLIMGGALYNAAAGGLQPADADFSDYTPLDDTTRFGVLGHGTRVCRGPDGWLMVYPLGAHGLYLAQTLSYTSIGNSTPDASALLLLGAALAAVLVLGVVLSLLLRRLISEPVQALQTQLTVIGGGDFTPNPAIEWPDEMGDIGRGINGLAVSIRGLMARKLEDERQKQDLEYQMLQNQINPHFIYNTLNSIKWMATIQNAPGIAEMTLALSRLLKSVSKGAERLVPLQEEFALLNDYFTIQQYRYGGTITMDVTYIEDERLCQSCRIPRFTLQPLVENAIFHGIEPKGCAGSINVTVRHDPENGDVLIALQDDGVGMTAEQIARALCAPSPEEAAAKYRHVGLWNVHRRLQYSFGAAYGLSLQSQPGCGTTVTVRLPPEFKEEETP